MSKAAENLDSGPLEYFFFLFHAFVFIEILTRYVVYCQNKPKSEHIVSEHINDYFEVCLHDILSSSDH